MHDFGIQVVRLLTTPIFPLNPLLLNAYSAAKASLLMKMLRTAIPQPPITALKIRFDLENRAVIWNASIWDRSTNLLVLGN